MAPSRRRRLTRPKGKQKVRKVLVTNQCPETASDSEDVNLQAGQESTVSTDAANAVDGNGDILTQVSSISEHNYCSSASETTIPTRNSTVHKQISEQVLLSGVACNELTVSTSDLLMQVKHRVDTFLHRRWISVVDREKIHIMCLSAQNNKSVQRTLEFSSDGSVELFVHRQLVCVDAFLENVDPFVPLDTDSVIYFVDRVVAVVNNVRSMEICSGFDDIKYEGVWASCPYGEADRNLYGECRYVETFRSLLCVRLVKCHKWRCGECAKMAVPLRRRAAAAAELERNKFTANKFLNEEQKLKKLADQRREIDSTKKKLTRVQQRMQDLIKKQGVAVEENMSSALIGILKNSDKITPAQSIFLQQQIKASQQKNASGMRWHPTMIRFALSVHITSPAAYELMRDTGMIKLPSSRTLFDYSHVKQVSEGIDAEVIAKLSDQVRVLSNKINVKTGQKEKHKMYHTLMGDEMYISQNLIFQKSSGKLIGYTSLDEIDRELKILQQHLDNYEKEVDETIASRIMVYMIKGVTNGLKYVVATYAVANMSVTQLKVWTWQVIGALERSGIAVVALVCDGSSVNRAFIKSHEPATPHPSGIVFDTINKCARGRKLYFLSDTPHLLKTIRNCFLNSRWDHKKSRRKMMKNKKRISWDFIIKLYEAKRGKTLRKTYKLNAMNVFPDSYGRMKVKYAGQVLSKTASTDLARQGWPEATETAIFMEKVNDWFDCLNGAHTSVAEKKRNPNVAAYREVSDHRFNLLDDFLKYLDDWEAEARSHDVTADASANLVDNLEDSEIDEGGPSEEEPTRASQKILSRQTLDGIRLTTLAFKPLVTFMLQEGASWINARIFTQDPLEQHFSKLRAGQGGSNNPNLGQSLRRTHDLDLIGEMGMKKRRGNSGQCCDFVEVTTEKLSKLKSTSSVKFMNA